MTELMKHRAELEVQIAVAETAWLEASEALEALGPQSDTNVSDTAEGDNENGPKGFRSLAELLTDHLGPGRPHRMDRPGPVPDARPRPAAGIAAAGAGQ